MTTRRMALQHIEAFRAVLATGSMTEAAKRLRTSQPQISRLVGQLERITQFPLFDRAGGRLSVTQEGARLAQEVEKAFMGLETLEAAAVAIRSFRTDKLRIAAMPRLAGGLLTDVTVRFMRDHPGVAISLRSGSAATVHEWVGSGLCDAGVAMLYQETQGVRVEPIATMDFVAILPKGHPLAAKESLAPKDFAGQPFVSAPAGGPLAARIDRVFQAAGIDRNIVAETDLGSSICALVGAGLGLGLVNPLAASDEQVRAGLEIRPFRPSIPMTIALIYPPHAKRSLLVEAFGDYARRACGELFSAVPGTRD